MRIFYNDLFKDNTKHLVAFLAVVDIACHFLGSTLISLFCIFGLIGVFTKGNLQGCLFKTWIYGKFFVICIWMLETVVTLILVPLYDSFYTAESVEYLMPEYIFRLIFLIMNTFATLQLMEFSRDEIKTMAGGQQPEQSMVELTVNTPL